MEEGGKVGSQRVLPVTWGGKKINTNGNKNMLWFLVRILLLFFLFFFFLAYISVLPKSLPLMLMKA